MVPGRSRPRPDGPRLIYVTRFASHRHGVWQLRGLRGFGRRGPGLGARCALEQAAAEPGTPDGERPPGSQAGVTDTPDPAALQRRSRALPRAREQAAARAGGAAAGGTVSAACGCPGSSRRHLVRAASVSQASRHPLCLSSCLPSCWSLSQPLASASLSVSLGVVFLSAVPVSCAGASSLGESL